MAISSFTAQGLAVSIYALGKLVVGETELGCTGWFAAWSKVKPTVKISIVFKTWQKYDG